MPETTTETAETTPQAPSRKREFAAAATATVVTLALTAGAGVVISAIADRVRNTINPNHSES